MRRSSYQCWIALKNINLREMVTIFCSICDDASWKFKQNIEIFSQDKHHFSFAHCDMFIFNSSSKQVSANQIGIFEAVCSKCLQKKKAAQAEKMYYPYYLSLRKNLVLMKAKNERLEQERSLLIREKQQINSSYREKINHQKQIGQKLLEQEKCLRLIDKQSVNNLIKINNFYQHICDMIGTEEISIMPPIEEFATRIGKIIDKEVQQFTFLISKNLGELIRKEEEKQQKIMNYQKMLIGSTSNLSSSKKIRLFNEKQLHQFQQFHEQMKEKLNHKIQKLGLLKKNIECMQSDMQKSSLLSSNIHDLLSQ